MCLQRGSLRNYCYLIIIINNSGKRAAREREREREKEKETKMRLMARTFLLPRKIFRTKVINFLLLFVARLVRYDVLIESSGKPLEKCGTRFSPTLSLSLSLSLIRLRL